MSRRKKFLDGLEDEASFEDLEKDIFGEDDSPNYKTSRSNSRTISGK